MLDSEFKNPLAAIIILFASIACWMMISFCLFYTIIEDMSYFWFGMFFAFALILYIVDFRVEVEDK